MRATILILATIAGFASQYAFADIVRHASIPESLWGTWAANTDECGKTDKSSITLSAKNYVSSNGSCTVEWVDETPGVKSPNFSAHLKCGANSRETTTNVILRQNDPNQISAGADFSSLRTLQRCSADPRR